MGVKFYKELDVQECADCRKKSDEVAVFYRRAREKKATTIKCYSRRYFSRQFGLLVIEV